MAHFIKLTDIAGHTIHQNIDTIDTFHKSTVSDNVSVISPIHDKPWECKESVEEIESMIHFPTV